jgi:diadenosine tetraphosphate (Ap4A) HIT family hydrolase
LGLLPSGPDPVGEWLVHHQPPTPHIGNCHAKSKRTAKKTAIYRSTMTFILDDKLGGDTFPVIKLGLCELRLMNDRRWPWLILVPQRPGITEIHELTPLDQTMLTFEANIAAQALKSVTNCEKINSGALGNIVRQLHMHVIARNSGDPAWPGPVWGHGTREPYAENDAKVFAKAILDAI